MNVLFLVGNDSGIDKTIEAEFEDVMAAGFGRFFFRRVRDEESKSFSSLLLLVRSQKWDIIHVVGHTNKDGLVLKSGEWIDRERFTILAQNSGAQLIFFNCCSLPVVAQHVVDNGVKIAISYASDVFDATAKDVAISFYNALNPRNSELDYDSVRTAFDSAKRLSGGLLIWHTDGIILNSVVRKITDRLDKMDTERTTVFNAYSVRTESMKYEMDRSLMEIRSKTSSAVQLQKTLGTIIVAIFFALFLIFIYIGIKESNILIDFFKGLLI